MPGVSILGRFVMIKYYRVPIGKTVAGWFMASWS